MTITSPSDTTVTWSDRQFSKWRVDGRSHLVEADVVLTPIWFSKGGLQWIMSFSGYFKYNKDKSRSIPGESISHWEDFWLFRSRQTRISIKGIQLWMDLMVWNFLEFYLVAAACSATESKSKQWKNSPFLRRWQSTQSSLLSYLWTSSTLPNTFCILSTLLFDSRFIAYSNCASLELW